MIAKKIHTRKIFLPDYTPKGEICPMILAGTGNRLKNGRVREIVV